MRRSRIGAVVLAAGASSRLGTPKQLLHFRGETLLRHATLAALGAELAPVVVVTGAHAEESRGQCADLGVREAFNSHWQTGLASSIHAGVEDLVRAEPTIEAVVLLLCDQPHVTVELVSALVSAFQSTDSPVVASTYGGTAGAPALFGRVLFAELARLQGVAGAKQVIAQHASDAQFVPFRDGDVDIDTPADVARLRLTRAVDPREWADRGSGAPSRGTPRSRSTPPRP